MLIGTIRQKARRCKVPFGGPSYAARVCACISRRDMSATLHHGWSVLGLRDKVETRAPRGDSLSLARPVVLTVTAGWFDSPINLSIVRWTR